MTTYYLDSNAVGAGDGTSWANAWPTISFGSGLVSGDILKVDRLHSELDIGLAVTFNAILSNPIRVICVDKSAGDALSTGAVIGFTGGGNPNGNLYSYGIEWRHSGTWNAAPSTNGKWEAENCRFCGTSVFGFQPSSGTRGVTEWKNCILDMSLATGASVSFVMSSANRFTWRGGEYILRPAGQTNAFTSGASAAGNMLIEGVKMTGTVTNVWGMTANTHTMKRLVFNRCQLPTYTNLIGALTLISYDQRPEFWGCRPGTIATPTIGPTLVDVTGSLDWTVARYRTGGAVDGQQATPYAWELISNAAAGDFTTPLASPQLTRWVLPGEQTITVYVASDVTLQDDELWLDVLSPSEDAPATSQAKFYCTRPAPLAAPADLTADAVSVWNGAGVGTKQKISVTINPTIAGPVEVRLFLAKPSVTVYADPRLEIA